MASAMTPTLSPSRVCSPSNTCRRPKGSPTRLLADTARYAATLGCDPASAEDACARSFIETFGARAYRRSLSSAEKDRLWALYRADARAFARLQRRDRSCRADDAAGAGVPLPCRVRRADRRHDIGRQGRPLRDGLAPLVFPVGHHARRAAVRRRAGRAARDPGGSAGPGAAHARRFSRPSGRELRQRHAVRTFGRRPHCKEPPAVPRAHPGDSAIA